MLIGLLLLLQSLRRIPLNPVTSSGSLQLQKSAKVCLGLKLHSPVNLLMPNCLGETQIEQPITTPPQAAPPLTFRLHTGSNIRLALVGDVHGLWEEGVDDVALNCLNADLVVFVGDYGEEDLELVAALARCSHPKVIMLGNHDAWCGSHGEGIGVAGCRPGHSGVAGCQAACGKHVARLSSLG